MTQNWRKLGLIHRPDTSKAWAVNGYCHVPTPLVMADTVRVYYASLDANMRGSIGYVDLRGDDLTKVKYVSPEPVLTPGPLGAFDSDGVVPSCILEIHGALFMYYIGFQRCESVPYMLFSGTACCHDGGLSFENYMKFPIIDRIRTEPYSRSAPFVMRDGNNWRCWYWSCREWTDGHYNNDIRVMKAYTADVWDRAGDLCITPEPPDYAVGRPWVVKEDGLYKMWMSLRGPNSYRMGYAESPDGLTWSRKDSEVASLMPADGGNAEYAAIVDSGGKRWCLYNGAQQGKDGIELAVLE